MLKQTKFIIAVCVVVSLLAAGSTALAQTALASTFTYQGSLSVSGAPHSGTCDFQFSLFTAAAAGTQVGTTSSQTLGVTNGVFSAQLDFGAAAFNGTDRYLAVSVRCPAGSGGFTALTPRQPVTPAPYAMNAIQANNAAQADTATTADQATVADALNGLVVQQNAISPNLIGGFSGNTVGGGVVGATIGGGGAAAAVNQINGNYTTISGGVKNVAGGTGATIGGGEENVAGSLYSVVGGGNQNSANGQFSVVPGGFGNLTSGEFAFAAGRRALAVHDGAFVWGDSTNADISSTAANQFIARASGGVTFYSNAGATTGVNLPANDGAWATLSDRNVKDNIQLVDPLTVLHDVIAMPISTWNYIAQGDSIRHIGPMAQDFYAAFGLGEDDRHISTIDADGVALAAIQGLYQVVQDKDAVIAALQAENAALKTRLDDIDQRLAALEGLAAPSQAGLGSPALLLALGAAGLGLLGWRASRKGRGL